MPTPAPRPFLLLLVVSLLGAAVPNLLSAVAAAAEGPDHLVISEVVTGGTSASDEFVELYNPTAAPLPLEGLELVYVSATGLTVSRRAAWELGAPEVPAGGHVLVANELGIYSAIADASYASGMAATGGSVALRILGAASAIDAVGWGTASSTWREGGVAAAPPAGSSLERLPGGALGSTRDTDDNATDFALRDLPDPENSASPPVPAPPSGSPSPVATATPVPTATPAITPVPTASGTATPTASPSAQPTAVPSPGQEVVPIGVARALPDGTAVTIEGVALTASGFADGGGYLVDESGGLAVLLSDGSFDRGLRLRVTGTIDDRYAQRTLRAASADVTVLGSAADPTPPAVATGAVGEDVEGRLVRIAGTVLAAPTPLSAGLAFEVDDGSGPARLLVGSGTGIDVSSWTAGFVVDAVGVVGQRDSSGTGTTGYRVQPRDAADIRSAGQGPSPSPSTSPGTSATPEPTPEPSQPGHIISVAAARQLPKGAAATVRGVVTLAPGLVDPTTAVLQDPTGAIVLRVGDEAGPVGRGTHVEVRGVRATLAGMETLRVSTPPRSLGTSTEPAPRAVATGAAGESHEAALVLVRGGVVAAPRRSSAGTVSFEIDDGSGPLRVAIGSSAGIDGSALSAGTWIEVRGVLGQETTGSLPLRGYRVWPRDAADLRVVAPATSGAASGSAATGGEAGSDTVTGHELESLEALGGAAVTGLPVGATLVLGPWEELGVGGLLWDGTRLVALHADAAPLVRGTLAGGRPPVSVQATGLRVVGQEASTGVPVAAVPDAPGAFVPSGLAPAAPLTAADAGGRDARWVSLVGRLDPRSSAPTLIVTGARILVEHQCDGETIREAATVSVTGILVGEPPRLVVPCGGIVRAPLLARVTSSPATAQGRPTVAVSEPIGRDGPSGTLPAALLLLAAASLVAGAGAARWAHRTPTGAPDAGDVEPETAVEEGSPPALTLVPLPRERAP